MALLNGALDDAGTNTGFLAYAVYIAFSRDWDGFTTDWQAVLKEKKLESLHTSD